MNDDQLRRLLHDAVADVTPTDRLSAIRASTTTKEDPMASSKFAVIAASVIGTAAVIAGIAWAGGMFGSPEPLPPTSDPTTTQEPTPDPEPEPDPVHETFTAAVYYLGDTPMGVRLYREFQQVSDETHLLAAVRAAVQGTPNDPDYWSPWPGTEVLSATEDGDQIRIELDSVPSASDVADSNEASQALEQVIYTAQAAIGQRLPVQFMAGGNPVAEVFGQPTSEPLAEGEWMSVLSLVSISDPAEGSTVSGGTLRVNGVASSFEATVPWRILADGTEVDAGFFAAEGWLEQLYPYGDDIDVSALEPGTYVLEVSTDDPSDGEGPGAFVDTRTFVIE
ncbi:Gmad2 immunoglobulin-like domain-containing protein [Nocardioides limicola]|uniref:Gmad2 immunoglobulin-like domain-containing protein n=1 Tax=Nocardioides limicola TaxID=2803368 RepID=UPI00193B58AE|nr:Gmad2 immunoglobulin-like domain-containing protein [Nocardioides sp. DJM-14]